MTLLLNYSHPITPEQRQQLEALLGAAPDIRDVVTQVDRSKTMREVAFELVAAANLSAEQWQTAAIVLNPPALAPVALALIAELHGRCGYFLPILNIRPVADALPPRFEIAEIVNLQDLRTAAREQRF